MSLHVRRIKSYAVPMSRIVSVRELRNDTASVVAAVESGESVTLTVNRRPVAEITPHREQRSPWVPSAVLERIRHEAPLDAAFLNDIAPAREMTVEER